MRLAIAFLAATPVGAAQELLYDLPHGVPLGTWRYSNVRGLSDLNGDGQAEFAVGTRVFSGADASLIFDAEATLGFGDPVTLDEIGDLDADGVPDLIFGKLLVDDQSSAPLVAVSGVDGALLGKARPQGWSPILDTLYFVAGGGDIDGDGIGDAVFSGFAIGFTVDGFWGYVSGATLSPATTVVPPSDLNGQTPSHGTIVSDVDGDGRDDVAFARFSRVEIVNDMPAYLQAVGGVLQSGLTTVETLGDMGDFDLDGYVDLVGTFRLPGFEYRPFVASGKDLALLLEPNLTSGSEAAGLGDIDCDGQVDFLTSDYFDDLITPQVELRSGSDASLLWSADEVARSIDSAGDVNGDGVADWIVGFDTHTQVWAGPGPTVATYCTGKQTSAGCTPSVDTAGFPTGSGPDNFLISTRNSLAQKPGLFFWGTAGRIAVPFLGGTLCVAPALQRGPVLVSQGPADCLAGYAFLFEQAYAGSFGLAGGEVVNGQFWMRDPNQADGTGVTLSDAVEFDWCP